VSLAGSRPARLAGVLHSGGKVATLVVALFSANLLFWHIPAIYNSTLRIASIHDLEHLTFLVLGLLFWDQLITVLGVTSRLSLIARASMILAGMGVSWALAIAIGYATLPLYAYPAPTGALSLLADQEIAAGVMWVPGSVPFLVTLIYLGIRWFDVEDRRATSAVAAPR
jgi:putative membrane protein